MLLVLTSGCIFVTSPRPFFDLWNLPLSLWSGSLVLVTSHSQALFRPVLEEASCSMSFPSRQIDNFQCSELSE